MATCKLCGKKQEKENIAYYHVEEFNLCRSHYFKWLKHHKPFIDAHKNIKPNTKEWTKLCREEEDLFKKWLANV